MASSPAKDLHASDWKGVFYVTGGGSGLLSSLLTVPGASASVLEAQVPYSENALAQLIGEVNSVAQVEVAGALGMKAYSRAQALTGERNPHGQVFGLGLTAALETTRPRRGANRAHMSVQTRSSTHRMTIELAKGRGREAEEDLVARVALVFLLESLDIRCESIPELASGDSITREVAHVGADLSELVWGNSRKFCVLGSGEQPRALLPGAFDPLHVAHRSMRSHAEQLLACPVAYELCVTNIDKPALDFVEIEERVRAFGADGDLWLTSMPLFAEKAEAFPRATFVVGADTIKRIAQTRYYGTEEERDASFREFSEHGARFLVYGRNLGGGFEGLEQLELPEALRALCSGIDQEEFHMDISSSEIRSGMDDATRRRKPAKGRW